MKIKPFEYVYNENKKKCKPIKIKDISDSSLKYRKKYNKIKNDSPDIDSGKIGNDERGIDLVLENGIIVDKQYNNQVARKMDNV